MVCDTFKIACYLSDTERFKQKIEGNEDKLNWEKLCSDGVIPVSQLVYYQDIYKFDLTNFPLHKLQIDFFIEFPQFFDWDPINNRSLYQRFHQGEFQLLYENGLIKKEQFLTIVEQQPSFYHFLFYSLSELVENKSTFILDLLEYPEVFELLLQRSILNASHGYYKWDEDNNKIPLIYNHSTIYMVINKFKNYLLEDDTWNARNCLRLICTVQMVEFFHNSKNAETSNIKEVTKLLFAFYQSIKNSIENTNFKKYDLDDTLLRCINQIMNISDYKTIPPVIMELIFRMNWSDLFNWLNNNKRDGIIPTSYSNRWFYWIRKKIYIIIFG